MHSIIFTKNVGFSVCKTRVNVNKPAFCVNLTFVFRTVNASFFAVYNFWTLLFRDWRFQYIPLYWLIKLPRNCQIDSKTYLLFASKQRK